MTVPDKEFEREPEGAWANRDARVTTILLLGRLVGSRGDALCRIRNVSCSGLMAEAHDDRFVAGEPVEVELKAGDRLAGMIRWAEQGRMGIAFSEAVEVGRFLAQASGRAGRQGAVRAPRFEADCIVGLRGQERGYTMRLVNLSQAGARLEGSAELAKGDLLTLAVPGLPDRRTAVQWIRGGVIGLAFLETFSFAELGGWLADDGKRFATRIERGPAA